MKLVPFILTKKQNGLYRITRCSLFLAHAGKNLWQTDETGWIPEESIKNEYLLPNGFSFTSLWIDKKVNLAFIKIDPSQTSLKDFYTWEEALQKSDKPECWRHFYFIQDKDESFWWSPKGIVEAEFPTGETIQSLFETIQTLSDT